MTSRNVLISIFILFGNTVTLGQVASEFPVETVVQKGHTDKINVMKFSRNGVFMVTGSADQNVKLWDLKSGREIRTFKGHQEGIEDIDIDLENGFIVSSGGTNRGSEIKVWDILTGEPKKTVKGGTALNLFNIDAWVWAFQIRTLAIGPDSETMLWGEDNLGIRIGKITKKRGKEVIDTDWQPNTIVFSPDGKYFAAGGDSLNSRIDGHSNEVKIWNFPSLEWHKTLQTKNYNVNKLVYSENSQFLACVNTKVVWESKPINSTGIPLTKKKYSNLITVFNLDTDEVVFEIEKLGWEIENLAFSPDGKYIAVPYSAYDTTFIAKTDVTKNELIYVYDVEAQELADSIDTQEFLIHSMGFTPDGKLLIANGNSINYWSVPDWQLVRKVSPPSKMEDFLISESGQITGSKNLDGERILFNLNRNTLSFASKESLAFNNFQWTDNSQLLAKSIGTRIIAESPTGLKNQIVLIDSIVGWDKITQFIISSDQRQLFCIGEDQKDILVKQLEGNAPISYLEGHRKEVVSIALSPDNKILASGSGDNKVNLWDLASGQKIKELLGHNQDVISLAFNHDGSVLASGSEDRNVKLWDVKKGVRIETLMGHGSHVLSLDFNDDGTRLVSSSGDLLMGGKSEIIIWDVKKKKKIKSFEGNEGYISKIVFKGNRIYSTGNDPVLRVYDGESGKDIYAYIPLGLNDYIIFTPDNYYSSTKLGVHAVHFVRGLTIFSFENYDLQYNRPDIILKRIGSDNQSLIGAYNKVYNRRLNRLGFDETMFTNDFQIPETQIVNKGIIPLVSDEKTVTFTFKLNDDFNQLERLHLWVNNVPIYGSNGLLVKDLVIQKDKKGSFMEKEVTVQLNQGRNKIQVSCLNNRGVESHKDGFDMIYTEGNVKPNLHILVVSVSDYQDQAMNLKYAAKDGHDMINFLKTNQNMYNQVIIDTLFNRQATREEFVKLKERLQNTQVDDQVMLFMAGHGLLDKEFNFNFASYNVDPENPEVNGISFELIESLVDSIPARKKLILIDACHSGEVDKEEIEDTALEIYSRSGGEGEMKKQSFDKLKMNVFNFYGINNTSIELMEQLFSNISQGSGAVIISAAAGNSYALESDEWENGVFTYSILNGLKDKSADLNQDGVVTVTELKNYVIDKVYTLTNGQQKPTSRKENLEFDYAIWK
jgi:WD40 repeat protein